MAEAKAVVQLGQARIAGRIQGVRRVTANGSTVFRTLFKLPAADQYSSPATVEVRSDERLGSTGDELSIVVNIGGYPRTYESKGADGEPSRVTTAENVLSFAQVA